MSMPEGLSSWSPGDGTVLRSPGVETSISVDNLDAHFHAVSGSFANMCDSVSKVHLLAGQIRAPRLDNRPVELTRNLRKISLKYSGRYRHF